jgi:hypothetical protein
MYIYHRGIQYDVADVLSREACEVNLSLNGQSGKWEAKVYWNWEKMDVKDYEGDSIEWVLCKAARDRIEEGDKD